MEKKYGFVYIWKDKKYSKYYIGCHWGTEDDGYICSSSWMMKSYKRRPHDFKKRRILSRVYTNRKDLLKEEYRWLSMIKKEELKIKYYNLHNHHFNHWSTNKNNIFSMKEKISIKTKEAMAKPEIKEKVSNASKKMWQNLEFKENWLKKNKEIQNDSEYKENMSKQIKKKWKDPEYLEKQRIKNEKQVRNPEFIKAALKAVSGPRKRVLCPYCNKEGGINLMYRYHFNNCKQKAQE